MIELFGLKFKRCYDNEFNKFNVHCYVCLDDKHFTMTFDNYDYSLEIFYKDPFLQNTNADHFKLRSLIDCYLQNVLPNKFSYFYKDCQKIIDDNISTICKKFILARDLDPDIKIFEKINNSLDKHSIFL
jgi:hypothetical protein